MERRSTGPNVIIWQPSPLVSVSFASGFQNALSKSREREGQCSRDEMTQKKLHLPRTLQKQVRVQAGSYEAGLLIRYKIEIKGLL